MYAKKSLGQHFLTSTKALSQIVDAGDMGADDLVLEIGPGKGVLTERILQKGATVIAIEKDRDLIPLLQEKFAESITSGKLTLINLDILKFDPLTLPQKSYKLIANIPYYITGAIIEQFLSTAHQPERMVLLMQREVAERIVARDAKQSILSVAVGAYGNASIVGRVPPGAFVPPPTVESAILLIQDINRTFFTDCDEKIFFSVMKAVFGKKRKQIGGSLGEYLDSKDRAQQILTTIGMDPKARPETVTLMDWKKLSQAIVKTIEK